MTDIPDTALRARQMYLAGSPIRVIKAETGLSQSQLYYWLDGGPKINGKRALPPIAKRQPRKPSGPEKKRAELVCRMMRAAERQVVAIEKRLADTQQQPGERERDARTLAVLAKTMQSLTALDALHEKDAPKPKAPKNESIPQSIDELRRSLTRKL